MAGATDPRPGFAGEHADPAAHRRALAREFFGTAAGLVLAHFVAFRLAAHLTSETGVAPAEVAQEALAGLAGGLLAGAVAALPFLIWDGDDALAGTLAALVGLPAVMGMAIARVRGRSWPVSLLAAAVAAVLALVVVLVKTALGH